jgi:hypothetical protein
MGAYVLGQAAAGQGNGHPRNWSIRAPLEEVGKQSAGAPARLNLLMHADLACSLCRLRVFEDFDGHASASDLVSGAEHETK